MVHWKQHRLFKASSRRELRSGYFPETVAPDLFRNFSCQLPLSMSGRCQSEHMWEYSRKIHSEASGRVLTFCATDAKLEECYDGKEEPTKKRQRDSKALADKSCRCRCCQQSHVISSAGFMSWPVCSTPRLDVLGVFLLMWTHLPAQSPAASTFSFVRIWKQLFTLITEPVSWHTGNTSSAAPRRKCHSFIVWCPHAFALYCQHTLLLLQQ